MDTERQSGGNGIISGDGGSGMINGDTAENGGGMRITENKLCDLDATAELERQTAIISYNTEAELSALQHKVGLCFLSTYVFEV